MPALGYDAVADVLYRNGFRGEGLVNGIATVFAESGGRPDNRGENRDAAVNPTKKNTWDRGLWQLNSYWHREVSDAAAYDANASSREAYRISSGGTNFSQWYGFTKGGYKKHLTAARAAAAGAAGRGGGPSGGVTLVTEPAAGDKGAGATQGAGSKVRVPAPPVHIGYNHPDALPGDDVPLRRGDVQIGGLRLAEGSARLVDRVTKMRLDMALESATQLSIDMADPGLELLASGLVVAGLKVFAAELPLIVSVLSLGNGDAGEALHLECREQMVELLKGARGPGPTGDLSPSDIARFWAESDAVRDSVVEDSPVRAGLAKQVDASDPYGQLETTWDQLNRYADELGFLFGIVGGVLYFARPSYVTANAPGFIVNYHAGRGDPNDPFAMLEMPEVRRGFDYSSGLVGSIDYAETLSVVLPQRRAARVRPGMRLELHGVPSFDGSYMVTRVTGDIDEDVTGWGVEAKKPKDPPPSLVENDAALPGATTAAAAGQPAKKGTKAAADFVSFCRAQAGKRYVYGAEVKLDDPNPKAFDCSELVQWGCAQVGLYIPDGSGNQLAFCQRAKLGIPVADAAKVAGALLFRGAGGGEHVAVSLGDGVHTIEARGSQYGVMEATVAGRFTAAALIPGMAYQVKAPV